MRRKHKFFTSIFAVAISASVLTACKAPGSDTPISAGGKDIKVKQQLSAKGTPGLPNGAISPRSANLNENDFKGPNVQQNQIKNIYRHKSDKFISLNQDIKYVALGDSISAGFDGSLDKDYQGKLENNGIISGVSYPSFLARLLNKKNRVKSYTNYSVSGSKIIDWIKLLEFNDPEIKNVDESTFNKLFPNVQQLRTELKQNLAKANLVTINLGANDFFNLVFDSLKNRDVLKIVKKFLAKKPVLNDAIIFFNDLFKDSLPQIRKRLTVFINNLKTLAPNANINLISYPMPLQYLFNVLNQYVSKDLLKDIGDLNISNIFIDTVNDNLQEVATNTKINFVNTYNDKYWNNNAKNLTSFFLDIHPGTKGYKKMALDLYLKITKPYLNLNYYKDYDFTNEFINKDAISAKYQIEVEPDSDLINIGENSNYYINLETNEEKKVKSHRSPSNFSKRISELSHIFEYYIDEFLDFMTNNSFYNELDTNGKLRNLLKKKISNKNNNFSNIVHSILDSKQFQDLFTNAQKQFNDLAEQKNLNFETLKSIFINNFGNIDNLSFIIKVIAKSDLLKNEKTELTAALKEIVHNFLKIYSARLNTYLTEIFGSKFTSFNIDVNELSKALSTYLNSNELKNLIDKFIDIFVNETNEFENINTINEFILGFFKKTENNTQIASLINQNIKFLLTNQEIKKFLSNSLFDFLQKHKLTKNITKDEISNSITDLFDLTNSLNKEFKLSDTLIKNFLSNLSTTSISSPSSVLSASLTDTLSQLFNDKNYEKNIVSLVKNVSKSKLITNHNNLLKKLIDNILDSNLIFDTLNNIEINTSSQSVNNFISDKALKKLINLITKNSSFKNIITSAINATITNYQSFQNVNSINDIIKNVLNHLDLDSLKNNFLNLTNSIINSEDLSFIISDVLTNLLKNYDIKIDSNLTKFIKDFSLDAKNIVKDLDILDPLINAIIESLKKVKTSSDPKEELNNLKIAISKVLEDKFNKNPKELVKKLLNREYITKNTKSASTIIKVILRKAIDNKTIKNILYQVLSSNQNIKEFIDDENLKELLDIILNDKNLDALITNLLPNLLSDQSWIDHIDNSFVFIKKIFENETNKIAVKTYLESLTTTLLNNEKSAKIIINLIDNLAKKYDIDLKEITKTNLIKNISKNLIPFLHEIGLFPSVFEILINNFQKSNNFNELSNNVLAEISSKINLSDYSIFKAFFRHFESLKDDKITIKNILNKIYDKLATNNEITNSLAQNIANIKLLKDANISNSDLSEIIKNTLKDQKVKTELLKLLDSVIDNFELLNKSNSFDELLMSLLQVEAIKSNSIETLKVLIAKIIEEDKFKALAAKILVSEIKNTEYKDILKDINNPESLIQSNLDLFKKINDELKLLDNIIPQLVETLKNKGTKLDFSVLTNQILKTLKEKYLNDNLEENIIKFIKHILENQNYDTHKDDLKTLLKNITNLAIDKIDFGNIVWNAIDQKSKDFINNNLIQQANFIKVINNVIKTSQAKDLIHHISDYIFDHKDKFKDTKNILNIFKTYFNEQNNKTKFTNDLKTFIKAGFKDQETINGIKNIINSGFNFLKIESNKHTQKVSEALANGLGDLLDRVGLYEKISNAIFNTVNKSDSLKSFSSNIVNEIINEIKPNEFNFIKLFFKDEIVQNNKEDFIYVLETAIGNLLDNEEKIKQTIESTGIASLLVSGSETNISLVNDFLVKATKNQDLRDILKTSIKDFIDRANQYQTNESWFEALNTLFNGNQANTIKDKFTNWIKTLFTNPEDKFTKGLAQVLISKLRAGGFNLQTTESDETLFNNIIKSFFSGLAKRNELTTIINKIFENIKNIQFSNEISKKLENLAKVKDAILTGALHMILTSDNKYISFRNILNQHEFLGALVDSIKDSDYVDLINRLFESSDRTKKTGIYNFIDSFLINPNGQSNKNNASVQNTNVQSASSSNKLGFAFDGANIFTVIDKTQSLMATLFKPIFRDMIQQAKNNNYNFANIKENKQYKAMFRLATLVLWFGHDKALSGRAFWNFFGLDFKSTFVTALGTAFNSAKQKYQNEFNSLTNDHKKAIGADYSGNYDYEFIVGNRSAGTTFSNYWQDQLLAYIYYRTSGKDRFTQKSMTDAILDALNTGYLGNRRS